MFQKFSNTSCLSNQIVHYRMLTASCFYFTTILYLYYNTFYNLKSYTYKIFININFKSISQCRLYQPITQKSYFICGKVLPSLS
ncbi:Hypothetical protein CKL_2327 [Clostridium kluyveri DSM 555]|uniref:Uncharacterized protein n=1 Tax=Clostridium kluyveri (strain ATCC 8527 / DSM 555 / NBRC 12016 / NCIMB 10680 / K1) TaxID=431943 RepID=A5MZP3_CLOK5|nr:Hypothetical protein CKL_2327 [Clostridium kluyveri DSM 555]